MKTQLTAATALIIGALIGYTFTPTQNLTKLSIDTSNGSVTQNGNSWDVAVSSNGYARINYKVPEQDSKYITNFDMTVNFTLPPTFYSDMKNGFRIITTDNFTTTLNGVTVGAKDANEWRCSVGYFAGDGLVHVKCEHEVAGSKPLELWTSPTKMTTGSHTIRFYGDMAQASPWAVIIDGVQVAGGTQRLCLTSELLDSECVVTRVRAGIDGGGAGVKLTVNSFSVAELSLSPNTPASALTVTISTNTPIPATVQKPTATPVPTLVRTSTPPATIAPCEISTSVSYIITVCKK